MADRYDYSHAARREKLISIIRSVLLWILAVGGAVALAYFLVHFGLAKTTVDASMSPTLDDGDRILVDRIRYKITKPKRNDIIVFCQDSNPDRKDAFYNVKRIVGLPGETIQIKNGGVFINGEEMTEVINADRMMIAGLATYEVKLGDDEYFVLGDSRNSSEDSRYASIGNVKRSEIIGYAWIRLNRFSFVNNLNRK
ncbi:MAG: signal peptidase I [Lachnospiraceae bacterium]|nr:signal peptidase I [Lachnospiraceae bacterium]MBR5667376.1 signal peptidase I [Lachnospiraceae bacterium]